jgi:hypothetical protein
MLDWYEWPDREDEFIRGREERGASVRKPAPPKDRAPVRLRAASGVAARSRNLPTGTASH